ncbi:DUF6093 family protein [Micromonospora sp. NBRC 107095]|uniref:DUF6093 family protein n=1 Tax=Micromonospora sp. NBRC 107095 TaxID=3032209 RepID=UPI0024A4F00F|nr:DUF6093 family protein [Micromonospora sp. NBRC 107095]GLZ62873.1 hypothetical protein Misp05_64490 [Micromonospora sp. NBRC 107095]
MSVEILLASGRRAIERLMVDQCVVRRDAGTTYDPETGYATPNTTEVYAGKCRVQQQTASAGQRDVGEATVLLLRLEVQVPMSVVGIRVDDVVEVTASVHDPDLPGRRFRVRELAHKTHATARRFGVEEVTS